VPVEGFLAESQLQARCVTAPHSLSHLVELVSSILCGSRVGGLGQSQAFLAPELPHDPIFVEG
jgi:hypothetical protein